MDTTRPRTYVHFICIIDIYTYVISQSRVPLLIYLHVGRLYIYPIQQTAYTNLRGRRLRLVQSRGHGQPPDPEPRQEAPRQQGLVVGGHPPIFVGVGHQVKSSILLVT